MRRIRVRFSIGGVMALLVLLAIDFAWIRTLFDSGESILIPDASLLVDFGVLGMTNLLAVAGYRLVIHGERREPFLGGFVRYGLVALSVYFVLMAAQFGPFLVVLESIYGLWEALMNLFPKSVRESFHSPEPCMVARIVVWPLTLMYCTVLLTLPQAVVGMVGGLRARRKARERVELDQRLNEIERKVDRVLNALGDLNSEPDRERTLIS